jgi:hypothetical protein
MPKGPLPEARAESILPGTVADQATDEDKLGFGPYVRAIADFLTNPHTSPPLTISIEGEWGSGKTSFMKQLIAELDARHQVTVEFNAWRHDTAKALWAAFALEFIRGIASGFSRTRRYLGHLLLFCLRFRWKTGWFELGRVAALYALAAITAAVGTYLIITAGPGALAQVIDHETTADWVAWIFGGLSGVAALFTLGGRVAKSLHNALSTDLQQYLQAPDYGEHIAFIERFHKDFKKIVAAYAGDATVYVFIDDLDRCEVPRAADLMQAVNLMISSNPQLVFIMGMDRAKVAAGFAVKHEKVLPYLCESERGDRGEGQTPTLTP